ncbi:hypothetical protein V8C37DRAFT_391429 [Trichoderma ceciliae]
MSFWIFFSFFVCLFVWGRGVLFFSLSFPLSFLFFLFFFSFFSFLFFFLSLHFCCQSLLRDNFGVENFFFA